MSFRLVIILAFQFLANISLACECSRGWGKNFLSNVNQFEFIALGILELDDESPRPAFVITKIYKGQMNTKRVTFSMGGFCDNYLDYKSGTQLIIGLVNAELSSEPTLLSLPGCITSAILVGDRIAEVPENQLPMFGKPRIGIFKRKMTLKHLENRIERKLWWNNLL
jgi:hypothetical protein